MARLLGRITLAGFLSLTLSQSVLLMAQEPLAKGEVQAIAEEAIIYGLPLMMNYDVMYQTYVDKTSSQYRGAMGVLHNTARVFTPQDTAVVTPNSDTPYSFFCADLRSEPVVFTVPKIEKQRYYSIQLIDWYTFNFGYVGSRTTGSRGGRYMIVGPRWQGETPAGIDGVFRCETDFVFAIYRTQLFNPADIENVKQVQAGYTLQTLSGYLDKPAPAAAATVNWPRVDKHSLEHNPLEQLGFVLQFCPAVGPAEVEKPLRARLAKIGIEAGKPLALNQLTAEQKAEFVAGVKSGMAKIQEQRNHLGAEQNGWRVITSGIGDRAVYDGDWLRRAVVAVAGIYANDPAEAVYPLLAADSQGNPPDCSQHRYTLTFPAGKLPPVNAFWSVTMYDAKTQLLVENPIDRYLINSPMLADLKKNPDGSLTIYMQHDSPGEELESNWLPAPDGPIYVAMRLYWPRNEALSGAWEPPAVEVVK